MWLTETSTFLIPFSFKICIYFHYKPFSYFMMFFLDMGTWERKSALKSGTSGITWVSVYSWAGLLLCQTLPTVSSFNPSDPEIFFFSVSRGELVGFTLTSHLPHLEPEQLAIFMMVSAYDQNPIIWHLVTELIYPSLASFLLMGLVEEECSIFASSDLGF